MKDKDINTLKFILILILAAFAAAGISILINMLFPIPMDKLVDAYIILLP